MPAKSNTRRVAKDESISVEEEAMKEAMDYLKSRLKPEEVSHLKQILTAEREEEEPAEDEKEEKPVAGKTPYAADSAGRSFADRWPNAARIRIGF